jgi:dTDP-4-dehydrorhamnose 3,5-epimerase
MPREFEDSMPFLKIEADRNIDGVIVTPKRKIFDDRGAIFHMLRADEPAFEAFGEIYFSQIHAGVVKAFHFHQSMKLNYYLVSGAVRLVLLDDRDTSPTRGRYQEFYLHPEDPKLVTIPARVWNGFKGIGTGPSLVANCATEPHRKDEISYRPHDDPAFGYDWSQRNG